MNKVILIGHVGADSELRFTQSQQPVLNFRVATTKRWKNDKGEKQEHTEWHNCVLWGKHGETMKQYIVKGQMINVEGELSTRQWEDKNGEKRYSTEIRVDHVELLGGGRGVERGSSGQARDRDERRPAEAEIDDSDLPF